MVGKWGVRPPDDAMLGRIVLYQRGYSEEQLESTGPELAVNTAMQFRHELLSKVVSVNKARTEHVIREVIKQAITEVVFTVATGPLVRISSTVALGAHAAETASTAARPATYLLRDATLSVDAAESSGMMAAKGVGTHFDDLAQFRRGMRMPVAGAADDTYTLAKLRIDGQDIYGISGHGQTTTFGRVNPITTTHAEADAVQQAIDAGLGGRGGRVQIFVDRAPCRACGRNNGIGSLARELGADEIEAVWPGGSQVFPATP